MKKYRDKDIFKSDFDFEILIFQRKSKVFFNLI